MPLLDATGQGGVEARQVDQIMGVGRADDAAASEKGKEVVFRAWRMGDTDEAASVGYKLVIGKGHSAEWKDFKGAKKGVVEFEAGEDVVEFSLNLTDDKFFEGRETFSIKLENAEGEGSAAVGDHGIVDGFIIDDEGPTRKADRFVATADAEAFRGGNGSDTVSYAASKKSVSADLAANEGKGGYAAGDSYMSIENLRGSGKDDELTGDSKANDLRGLKGNDLIRGGKGKDDLRGGADGDRLYGGDGKDALRGDGGQDKLYGGAGQDALRGGGGKDLLVGGLGADKLWGDGGADIFKFQKGGGLDRIMDYQDGLDRMKVAVSGFGKLDISQQGKNALVEAGSMKFLVMNADADDLGTGDFIFG